MRICPRCHLSYHEGERRCLVDGEALDEVTDERIGSVLAGRYVLEEVLGEGGMATVYRARHNLVERPCAVKILHPELSQDPTLRERLRREARSAAAIAHPNVVEIYDFGETPTGEPFLVMELLEGQPLRALIGALEIPQAIDLGMQIAAGLARAHDLGVVHRDLKPENVFVVDTKEGPLAKIVDFGLARAQREDRLTATGQIVGTPPYMAPERFKEREVTPAADLYALGIVLHEMLTGALPFESNNLAGFILAHLETPPSTITRPGVPEDLRALISALLEKRPEERPVDAHQVVERLRKLQRPAARRRTFPATSRVSLPRTVVTLSRWEARLRLYDEMLARAFPEGCPPELSAYLAEMRDKLEGLGLLRGVALEAQRELERLEAETVATRERLGHAIHVLAVDLSAARADLKALQLRHEEHGEELRISRIDWRTADAQLQGLRTDPERAVGDAEVSAARRALAAIEAWQSAEVRLESTSLRLDHTRDRERDLRFQVDALRQRLAGVESDFDAAARESRARLSDNGIERRTAEMRIIWLASKLSAPLRERSDLAALFEQIEAA